MKAPRLVFFGTSEFAAVALRAVADWTVHVVSQPSRPSGRGRFLKPTPVAAAAEQIGLPCSTPERARDPEFVVFIENLKPDALLVAAYGQILSERLLGAATRGGINLHASLLPKYRGAAPIQCAILEGETTTGITLMQMDKGMDTGDIIARSSTPIGESETAGELELRLAEIAAQMVREWMPKICDGEYERISQDNNQATYAPKLERKDGELTCLESADACLRRFRACTPRPGAWIATTFGAIGLIAAKATQSATIKPGTVAQTTREGVFVACSEDLICLELVKPEGKQQMPAWDWANGHRLKPGHSILEKHSQK